MERYRQWRVWQGEVGDGLSGEGECWGLCPCKYLRPWQLSLFYMPHNHRILQMGTKWLRGAKKLAQSHIVKENDWALIETMLIPLRHFTLLRNCKTQIYSLLSKPPICLDLSDSSLPTYSEFPSWAIPQPPPKHNASDKPEKQKQKLS